ncbi:MAG: phage protein Gp36 family protein [Candidatus Heimdallarchaeota archaeon]
MAGNYVSQSDIENVFGVNNVIAYSNLDNDSTTVNATRVQAAIEWAESYVNSRFRDGKYQIPFSSACKEVINWCATLAGIWLYEARGLRDENEEGNKLEEKKKEVNSEIASCLAGELRLDVERHDSNAPSAPMVIE